MIGLFGPTGLCTKVDDRSIIQNDLIVLDDARVKRLKPRRKRKRNER